MNLVRRGKKQRDHRPNAAGLDLYSATSPYPQPVGSTGKPPFPSQRGLPPDIFGGARWKMYCRSIHSFLVCPLRLPLPPTPRLWQHSASCPPCGEKLWRNAVRASCAAYGDDSSATAGALPGGCLEGAPSSCKFAEAGPLCLNSLGRRFR